MAEDEACLRRALDALRRSSEEDRQPLKVFKDGYDMLTFLF